MPIPQDLADRLRSELTRQGQELDWLELWPVVVRARIEVLDALSAIDNQTAERSDEHAAEAGWSICETLRHLHLSSIGVADIIRDLAAGQPVRNGTYEWEGDVTAHEIAPELSGSFDDLRHAFALHSVDFSAIPHNLPPKPNLKTPSRTCISATSTAAPGSFSRRSTTTHTCASSRPCLPRIKTSSSAGLGWVEER